MSASPPASIRVRPFSDDDEPGVLDLLEAAMGGGPTGRRTAEFFRWKHLESPFGRSFLMLAEEAGRIVGLRAFMRWEFEGAHGPVSAVRAVDTATHPDFQGRGIFTRLTMEALDALRGATDLVFNTPNQQSLPGYLKMGWKVCGKVPIHVRVRRPLRFARGARSVRSAADTPRAAAPRSEATIDDALGDGVAVAELIEASAPAERRLHTARSVPLLRWRYSPRSLLGYSCVRVEDAGGVAGLGIFRVRPRGTLTEATVADVIVRHGDVGAVRRVLKAIASTTRTDHVTAHWAPRTTGAGGAKASGFLRMPGGMILVVNPLRDGIVPDPSDLGSWAFTLGDLEVF